MTQAIHKVGRKSTRTARWDEVGRRIAQLLAGSWRDSEGSAPTLSEAELNEIAPLLCETGAGALAWWQIRNTTLANTESGQQLHDVYRRHRLSARVHEREIAEVSSLLRAEGIEPVLIKGWAIARLYPDAGLRPYGDIDLCVRPDQLEQATAALKCLEELDGHSVDLHSGFARIGQTRPEDDIRRLRRFRINAGEMRVWDELFNRSQLAPLHQSKVQSPMSKVMSEPGAVATGSQAESWSLDFGQTVRIPSNEDHLRILSAHLLRSGARRPPWLCDIALLLEEVQSPTFKDESRSTFNWDICIRDRLHDNWVASAVMLAHELLGAEISHTPFADRRAPRWLAPAVQRQWGRARVPNPADERRLWTLGLEIWGSLYARCDNPVRATAAVGGQFNSFPRAPYRVAEVLKRVPEAPQQLLSLFNQLKVTARSSEVSSEERAGRTGWNAKLRLREE